MPFVQDLVLLVPHLLPTSTLGTGRLGKLSAATQPGTDAVRIPTQTCGCRVCDLDRHATTLPLDRTLI